MVRRVIRLVVVGWIVGMVAASIAALSMKRRLGPTTDESADDVNVVAIFGPLAYHCTATALRGGTVECWYGGGVLDLRDAVLAPEGATLHVRAVFGGGQILVPADWHVVTRLRGMGGISDTRPAVGHQAGSPELVIEGVAIAGGFAVTSELEEGEAEWLAEMKSKTGTNGSTVIAATTPDEPAPEPAATDELAPAT